MKKLFWIFIVFFLLLIEGFYFISLSGSRTVVFKRPQVGELNDFYASSSNPGLDHEQEKPFYMETLSDIRDRFILEGKNFLEINLQKKKVRLYKDGGLEREEQILTVGDPQGWGGSALGIYKILSGNKLSFSIVSNVYMPYALHYYGKYYLHGEPYYPGGGKLISSVSGGCIRLNDKAAEEIYELTEINMPVLVIGEEKDDYSPASKHLSDFPEISATSCLVADLSSGFVFAEKNSQEQLPIASLTKLMTAVVVSENVDLRKYITVRPEMLKAYGSTAGLDEGKRFNVIDLFYALLIESSNDAAEVLSHFLGRTRTIKMMNEKAKAILMNHTKFVDPHGFSTDNVSTAKDLFQLARYVLNTRPPLLDITKGKKVRMFSGLHFDIKNFWNKNIFINDPNFVGGKTGYLRKARNTAVFIFRFLEHNTSRPVSNASTSSNIGQRTRDIAIILLGSEDDEADTQKIYKWLLENYPLSQAFSGDEEKQDE